MSKLWGQKADTGKVAGVEMEQTAKGIEVLVDEKNVLYDDRSGGYLSLMTSKLIKLHT